MKSASGARAIVKQPQILAAENATSHFGTQAFAKGVD
jgi:hypothetical protein